MGLLMTGFIGPVLNNKKIKHWEELFNERKSRD